MSGLGAIYNSWSNNTPYARSERLGPSGSGRTTKQWLSSQCDIDCARARGGRVKRPNVAFGWAAGDLAVGGSTGSPDVLAQSEDAGGVEANIPDAPVGARPRNGAASAPLRPTQLATLLGH